MWSGAPERRFGRSETLSLQLPTRRPPAKRTVLCIFWHSTEIVAGCSPQVPDEAAMHRVRARIFSFFTWLKTHFPVRGCTLTQVFDEAWQARDRETGPAWPARAELGPLPGDW